MDGKGESLIVRNYRLHQSFLSRNAAMQNLSALSHDALLDSFLALFEECCKSGLQKDINVSYFVNKYKTLVTEIKSLRISLNDFEVKAVIGRGYFGEVRLVKEKSSGDLYSLKKINKCKTLSNSSAALFEEERDILSSANSPWLTCLQYAFQDLENLYFVMEYHPGGDLLSLLEKEGGKLPIDHVRFYLAETLLAIHDLHSMGYVHRDVKPDNILLDRCGHIKLADFGSAARLKDGRVTTAMPAGTPDYVAPEVLKTLKDAKKSSYGTECDFWSLGVLGYALVVGTSPFAGSRTSITYTKILNHQASISYPDGASVTDSLKDLLNGLLSPAESRLDYRTTRKHLFFVEIDFRNIRQVMPPHVPVISSPDDVSNFVCERKTVELVVTPRENNNNFSGKQLPFVGFTYTPFVESSKPSVADTRVPERNSESLEAQRKINQELLAKLLAARDLSAERNENSAARHLERAEKEIVNLQRELAKEKHEAANLRHIIEQERIDRKQVEEAALSKIRTRTHARDREHQSAVKSLQAKIEELTDRLTEQHTIHNELVSRCDRAENDVAALRVELDSVRLEENVYKEKLTKAREYKRRSVTGFESRLDKLQNDYQHRENKWQDKLNAEVEARKVLVLEIQELKAEKTKLFDERAVLENKIAEMSCKLYTTQAELTDVKDTPSDKSNEKYLEEQLTIKQTEISQLRVKVMKLETELSNSNQSFLEVESNGQREYAKELEAELRMVSQEKLEVQSKAQAMKEQMKENANKLMDVMKKLGALEQEVIKLEKENEALKESKDKKQETSPLTSETETQYKQRIVILEEIITKLEGQIEQLRETAVIEKQEYRSTQSQLYKTKKELSDAKIDIRIAQRETKTAEAEVKKLQDELQLLQGKLKTAKSEAQESLNMETKKLQSALEELKRKDEEIAKLKIVQNEVERLAAAEKRLESEYNGLRQQQLSTDRQLDITKKELAALEKEANSLRSEKVALSTLVEELRSRIGNLELNNSCLKEAASMLDEQVADYEKFTAEQSSKTQALLLENAEFSRKLTQLQSELAATKSALATMTEGRTQAEAKISNLELLLGDKGDALHELVTQLNHVKGTAETLSVRLMEKEQALSEAEIELYNKGRLIESLQSDVAWLKEETSAHLTNFYALKEANDKLSQDLEEETKYSDALQERIRELENVVKELEAFHSQRETKDNATMQQQNKLIDFLQAKLQDPKKKKTLASKLFGPKSKDSPPSPQSPKVTSPKPHVSKSTENVRKKVLSPCKSASNSPRMCQALSQLIDSPSTRMQRQASLPRMHHKIPHRFKAQRSTVASKCISCHDAIPRGTTISNCVHCKVTAHPKCALTAPKTCGLPTALAQHFAKSVEKPNETSSTSSALNNAADASKVEGWIDVMIPGEAAWKRKYVIAEKSELLFFETTPDSTTTPSRRWDLASSSGQMLVADTVTSDELSSVAKNDLPFVIKIACIPSTTCWPTQTHFLRVLTPADKPKWLAALQCAVSSVPISSDKPAGPENLVTVVFQDKDNYGVNCVEQISDKIVLIGSDKGLFSLQKPSSPVKLHGVTSVHDLAVAPHINLALFICGENRVLLSADYRMLVSNSAAAACSSPGIKTDTVAINNDDPVLLFKISPHTDGQVYLTVAIASRVIFLRWDVSSCTFSVLMSMNTSVPCSCLLYHEHSVIIGCETFTCVSLKDFSMKELLGRPNMNNSFIRLRSFPMHVCLVGPSEFLLCYKEFGLFVDVNGEKTRADLKWGNVPRGFAFCAPYLYIISSACVEMLKIEAAPEIPSSDDSSSISTIVTMRDNQTLTLNNPRFLGLNPSVGMFVTNGDDVVMVDMRKIEAQAVGSCGDLLRTSSEGQFSFTSSLIGSLDDSDLGGLLSPSDCVQRTAL